MKPILVALDSSPRAVHVLAAAVKLAKGLGTRVVLFRAVGVPPEVPPEAYGVTPDELAELLKRKARTELEARAGGLPAELVAGVEVVLGTAWRAITEAASARGCEMIVLGSHGYDAIDRVLGTTAAKVVNHAPCSVLVVR